MAEPYNLLKSSLVQSTRKMLAQSEEIFFGLNESFSRSLLCTLIIVSLSPYLFLFLCSERLCVGDHNT